MAPNDLTGTHRRGEVRSPHRVTSQGLTDARIHWATASQAGIAGPHRALPVRCVSLVERHLTGATYQSLADRVAGEPYTPRKPGRRMAMRIDITMSDGTGVFLHASGGYAPDVMNDLQNRARELMSHAASLVMPATEDDEEVSE